MIQRGLAFLREARNAPVHPATALLGAACLVLGGAVVQRYVQQQQAQLRAAWLDLQTAARATEDLVAARANYPTVEDLDPVGRGDQADDDEVPDTDLHFEDLSDVDAELARIGTTEGQG